MKIRIEYFVTVVVVLSVAYSNRVVLGALGTLEVVERADPRGDIGAAVG
jgi:hypothetical protein